MPMALLPSSRASSSAWITICFARGLKCSKGVIGSLRARRRARRGGYPAVMPASAADCRRKIVSAPMERPLRSAFPRRRS